MNKLITHKTLGRNGTIFVINFFLRNFLSFLLDVIEITSQKIEVIVCTMVVRKCIRYPVLYITMFLCERCNNSWRQCSVSQSWHWSCRPVCPHKKSLVGKSRVPVYIELKPQCQGPVEHCLSETLQKVFMLVGFSRPPYIEVIWHWPGPQKTRSHDGGQVDQGPKKLEVMTLVR